MIEFVTLTGKIESGHVGCSAFGRTFYARPMFITAFQSIPSEEWLTKYHKEFFGLVAYENQKDNFDYDRPILLGVVPANKPANGTEALLDKHFMKTSKYRIIADDTSDELKLERFDGSSIHIKNNKVFINSDDIQLGAEAADYSAVLGQELITVLQDLINTIKSAKTNTLLGPQPFMPNTQIALSEILDNLEGILSTKVKLN